jgi:hypothetical protein
MVSADGLPHQAVTLCHHPVIQQAIDAPKNASNGPRLGTTPVLAFSHV